MLNHLPSPILFQDQESIKNSLLGLNPAKRSPQRLRLPTTARKHSLDGVLHHISKYKLYDKIILGVHKQQPKIQLHYNKLISNANASTISAKKKSKRNSLTAKQQHTISFCEMGRLNHKLVSLRPKGMTFSKDVLLKKQSVTLPLMKSISLKQEDINPRDKRIQDLFMKISKREANQFVYDISFPKKLLLDYLAEEFSPKFSTYFSWFMELRPIIDYYYYVSLGNRFLKMDIYKIAHFTYSAFDGFSFQNSLEVFMHDYGASDLMTIISNRQHFKDVESSLNDFQKKTLTELQQQKSTARIHRTVMKSNTLYRRTFQFRQFNGIEEVEKKQPKNQPKKGQITFQQFCELYSHKIPSIYRQLLKKLYFIDVIDSQKGVTIDRREESYNRERNATKESFSPTKNKQKKKKRQRAFGL